MVLLYTPKQKQAAMEYFNNNDIQVDEGMANLDKLLGKRLLTKIGGLDGNGYDLVGQTVACLYDMGITPTIVHGGSSEISRAMERKGLKPKIVNGLRTVPDQNTLDAVVEGLSYVNNQLVKAINYHTWSKIAVGLMEEKIVYAEKHQPVIDGKTEELVDLGFVGMVTRVNMDIINPYLEQGKIPVIWCIGYEDEQQLNVNADHVGTAFAPHFDKYSLQTSIGGYLNENGKIVKEMTLEQARKHNASDGMSLKLDSVIEVLESTHHDNVPIHSPEDYPFMLFTNNGNWTTITK